jgi:hypothetical protein
MATRELRMPRGLGIQRQSSRMVQAEAPGADSRIHKKTLKNEDECSRLFRNAVKTIVDTGDFIISTKAIGLWFRGGYSIHPAVRNKDRWVCQQLLNAAEFLMDRSHGIIAYCPLKMEGIRGILATENRAQISRNKPSAYLPLSGDKVAGVLIHNEASREPWMYRLIFQYHNEIRKMEFDRYVKLARRVRRLKRNHGILLAKSERRENG